MARLNVYGLKRFVSKQETRTFTDPQGEITLTLQKLGNVEMGLALDGFKRLRNQYIPTDENGGEVMDFPALGGHIVPVSESLLQKVAIRAAMQPIDCEEPYSAEELYAMEAALDPQTLAEMDKFAAEVQGDVVPLPTKETSAG